MIEFYRFPAMPLLRAAPVLVTDRERRQLKALERQPTCPQQIAMHARIILLASRDVGVRATADELGIGRSLDHKFTQGRPAHVGLRGQELVLQGSGSAGTEQGGRNYDQGLEDLCDKINKFIGYFNETMAKPFRWTYQGKPLTA